MLHIDNTIVNKENTVILRSFALNGMFSILACVDGTQPHPNISTKIRLSKTIYIGINIGIIANGNNAIIFYFMQSHSFVKLESDYLFLFLNLHK